MASTYSPLLRLELPAPGEQAGLWGNTLNTQLGSLLEQAIAGVTLITLTGVGDYTLTTTSGTPDQHRAAVLVFGGTPGGAVNIIVPATHKSWIVKNGTPSTLTIKTSGQVGAPTVAAGASTTLYCDGTSVNYGITAMSLGQGGTGGSTAATARTSLDVPSRSGSDATGTWPISITGTAALATLATTAATVTNGVYTTDLTTGSASSANKVPRFNSNGDISFGSAAVGLWNGSGSGINSDPVFGAEFGNHASISCNHVGLSEFYRTVTWLSSGMVYSNGGWRTKNASTTGTVIELADGGFTLYNTPYIANAGTTSTLTTRFHVTAAGHVHAASYNTTSDARLKKDVEKLSRALDKIRRMYGYTYTNTISGERQVGLMAQDVQKVVPEAVSEGSDGYLRVAYGNLVALAFEGIKALEVTVKAQQNVITAMEARLTALERNRA